MIRQAISCDLCGTEKKQNNHWFVAYNQAGELRLRGWNPRNRLHPGSKHLCGETCVHTLVDDYMAKALAARALPAVADEAEVVEKFAGASIGLTSFMDYEEVESSARLLPQPMPVKPERPLLMPADELISMPEKIQAEEPALPSSGPPRFTSRNRRAEACNRERAPHTGERRSDSTIRRHSK